MDKAIILRHRVEPGLYALVAVLCHQYSSKWRSHQVVSQQAIDQVISLGWKNRLICIRWIVGQICTYHLHLTTVNCYSYLETYIVLSELWCLNNDKIKNDRVKKFAIVRIRKSGLPQLLLSSSSSSSSPFCLSHLHIFCFIWLFLSTFASLLCCCLYYYLLHDESRKPPDGFFKQVFVRSPQKLLMIHAFPPRWSYSSVETSILFSHGAGLGKEPSRPLCEYEWRGKTGNTLTRVHNSPVSNVVKLLWY